MNSQQKKAAAKRRNARIRKNPEFTEEEWEALSLVLGCCQRCGSTEDLTKEHIIPIGKGGANTLDNLSVLCRGCNELKGSKKLPNFIPSLLLPSQERALNSLSPELRDRLRKKLGYDTSYS